MTPPLPRAVPVILGLCAALGAAPPLTVEPPARRPDTPATAEPPAFTLIGPDLSIRAVRVTGWSAAGLAVAEEAGIETELPRSRAAALAPASWSGVGGVGGAGAEPAADAPAAAAPQGKGERAGAGVIELTDGQRFVGDPAMEDAGPDHVAWDHARLGRLRLPLERVRSIETGLGEGGAPPVPAGHDDEVVLVNGDRVSGLIESIGAAVVVATSGGGGGAAGRGAGRIEIPLDRVRSIALVNPATDPAGTMLWMGDGSVVRAQGLEVRAGSPGVGAGTTLEIRPQDDLGSRAGVWHLPEIAAVNFDAAALRPLAAMHIRAQGRAPGAARRRIEDVRVLRPEPGPDGPATAPLGAADIEFPGPMTADWDLPAGATRLAGWAELPEAFRAWGDCEVTISLVGGRGADAREVWRRRINAEAPTARFDVPVSGAAVRITVEPGERGPVQDRIVIRRALIAVGR